MSEKPIQSLLRIDASARLKTSITRELGSEIITRLAALNPGLQIRHRDLAEGMPLLDEEWINANMTQPAQRNPRQLARLAESEGLVKEVEQADAIVLTVPIYNFSVPAVLKAWLDQICRVGLTFRYSEQGPEGLLADRPVYLVIASGGVPLGSPMDFASGYLRQVLGFIGIRDIRLVPAECTNTDSAGARERALESLREWLPRAETA